MNFTVVRERQEAAHSPEVLASFEAIMLPHRVATHICQVAGSQPGGRAGCRAGGLYARVSILRRISRRQRPGLAADNCSEHVVHAVQEKGSGRYSPPVLTKSTLGPPMNESVPRPFSSAVKMGVD